MSESTKEPGVTVAVDTGGTFTDVVLRRGDQVITHKLPSTPDDPSRAVLDGIAAALHQLETPGVPTVIHGSTVATNALLEGRGGKVAFVTTAGFEDTLHIARQNRPRLYAQVATRRQPPVQRGACFGVRERMGCHGDVVQAIADLDGLFDGLGDVEAVAVSLLHSYANPAHERAVADAIRARFPRLHITVSSDLLPEFREYERAATTVANAVVAPRMGAYIDRLRRELGDGLRIMSSAGGSLTAEETVAQPVHTVLSGPAGGVVGAMAAGRAAGMDRLLTFDMGGTSTDVSLCDGAPSISRGAEIAGLPIRVPTLDIHTVGAGGGSIAWVDGGGALRVGPESAGAQPGPACYGRGGQRATVTDANVVLGRLVPDAFLGGGMLLDAQAAAQAVARVAERLGASLRDTAHGIVRVAEATMARALKVISVEQGHDPRDFALVTFGGAGGLHACSLAAELGVRTVLVPPDPGLLSAVGMQFAPAVYTQSRAVLAPLGPLDALPLPPELAEAAQRRLAAQGFDATSRILSWTCDLRYAGQSHELEIDADPSAGTTTVLERFAALHERLYGYRTERTVELVAVRLRAEGRRAVPPFTAPSGTRTRIDGTVVRADLAWGASGAGPALITEYSSTTWVPEGWSAEVVQGGSVVLRAGGSAPAGDPS